MPKQASADYNFADSHPVLLREWDYSRNPIPPEKYTPSSGKKVWWICSVCKHNWEASIDNRIKPHRCPCCSGRKVHSDGHNSLAVLRPKLVLDWNDDRSPEEFRIGSKYRANWKCHKCNHEWRTMIYKRAELERRCLSCTGQQAHSSGEDSVKQLHPELMDEWNDDRNPSRFLPGSSVYIDWKCRNCSHEWSMQIKRRTPGPQGGQGCTFCNGPGGKYSRAIHSDGRNSMRNENDLLTLEFHPTLNGKLTPDNLTAGTNKKLWWRCSLDCDYIEGEICENVWQNTGGHRVGGQICPVHNNGGLHSDGRNSLSVLIPRLVEEWDFERNTELSPDEVTISSGKKAHWKCSECGNRWHAIIANRSKGHGCSACKKKTQKILFNYLSGMLSQYNIIFDYKHPDLRFSPTERQVQLGRKGSKMELDIWIPDLSLAIEYQGEQHYLPISHWGGEGALNENQRRDSEKVSACKDNGITLLTLDYNWDRKEESIRILLNNSGFHHILSPN